MYAEIKKSKVTVNKIDSCSQVFKIKNHAPYLGGEYKRKGGGAFSGRTGGRLTWEAESPIQMWKPGWKEKQFKIDPTDKEIVIYLVNETGSVHGHTVLVAEGWNADGQGGGTRWYNTWSFEPDPNDTGNKSFGGVSGGIKAKLLAKHDGNQGDATKHMLSNNYEVGWAKKISVEEFEKLKNIISDEKNMIEQGKVKYVAFGNPLGAINGLRKWEWHDNCNSWANKVLRKAGIISKLWGANYYLPSVPVITAKTYK